MKRWGVIPYLVLALIFVLPAQAHVPVNTAENTALGGAVAVDNPQKSFVFYGYLHDPGDVAYYRLILSAGDQFPVSLINAGPGKPVPDMVILVPGDSPRPGDIPAQVTIPEGYRGELIRGLAQPHGEYEPFTPAAIFTVARYSRQIIIPGVYYVAVVSPAADTPYSIATGYREEFSPSEWVMVPLNGITVHQWEGQSVLTLLTPFLAVVILGLILVLRREKRRTVHPPIGFWLATIAGLCYLGGAAVTFVQMVRVVGIAGFSPAVGITLFFALVPLVLGVGALRVARKTGPWTIRDRLSLGVIGVLGAVFWAGFIIGPVLAGIAAVFPDSLAPSP
jgi:hypothetical protein